jgi:hypothetical protein
MTNPARFTCSVCGKQVSKQPNHAYTRTPTPMESAGTTPGAGTSPSRSPTSPKRYAYAASKQD